MTSYLTVLQLSLESKENRVLSCWNVAQSDELPATAVHLYLVSAIAIQCRGNRCSLHLLSELHPTLHHSQLLTAALVHFTSQLQYYIMFEVQM